MTRLGEAASVRLERKPLKVCRPEGDSRGREATLQGQVPPLLCGVHQFAGQLPNQTEKQKAECLYFLNVTSIYS